MAVDERIAKLHPRHNHFVQIVDPWHVRVLSRNHPGFTQACKEWRFHQGVGDATVHAGEVLLVWYSVDAEGYILQEWGVDSPGNVIEQETQWPGPVVA